jgi:alkanesulfonate monooxygenase SsuD/methylene tetrahydromethanopterin reductase-like flavin-dependent oxidoreductase (luciferase family)
MAISHARLAIARDFAEDIATVDIISGGRFELGVGIGFKREEFSGFGVSSKERGARTDQSLEIIRRALSGGTVTFKSDFFDFQNIKVTPETSAADLARRLYTSGAAPRGPLWRWLHRARRKSGHL